jgi:BMFP domain-containing protein YqiC
MIHNFGGEVAMFDPKQLDEITRRVADALPPGFSDIQHDVKKNLRAAMQATFAKLDLVTREEFEVQSAVLQRTREKLEALEASIADLEKQNKKG